MKSSQYSKNGGQTSHLVIDQTKDNSNHYLSEDGENVPSPEDKDKDGKIKPSNNNNPYLILMIQIQIQIQKKDLKHSSKFHNTHPLNQISVENRSGPL